MNSIYPAGNKQPSPLFQKLAKRCLEELATSVDGIQSVLLASADGFEIASYIQQSSLNGGKTSAVSTSILSLIQSFTSEIHLSECKSLVLDAENGKAIITEIPHDASPKVLVVIASEQALLGHVLHGIRHCSNQLIAAH